MHPKTVPQCVKKQEQAIRCYTAVGETLYKRDSKKGGRKQGKEEEREGGREKKKRRVARKQAQRG